MMANVCSILLVDENIVTLLQCREASKTKMFKYNLCSKIYPFKLVKKYYR